MNKKSQTWVFDYLTGFFIFIFILLLSINLIKSIDAHSQYENINREVDFISNALMSTGVPTNWNSSHVSVPGLLSDYKMNQTKLENFDSLTYGRSKALLQVTGEYWFYFQNESGIMNISGKCVHGYTFEDCEIPEVTTEYSDMAWSERIIVFDSKIISLMVVSWI